MREIYLDFLHQSKPASRASWIMLAIGVGLGIIVMIANVQGEAALSAARDAAKKAGSESASTAATRPGSQRAVTLNDPAWENLLTRLEQTKPKAVSILQLEADGVAGTASIIAETNDANEMLTYLGKLGSEPGLRQVVLSQHIETESPANGAIRFTLRMQWGRP